MATIGASPGMFSRPVEIENAVAAARDPFQGGEDIDTDSDVARYLMMAVKTNENSLQRLRGLEAKMAKERADLQAESAAFKLKDSEAEAELRAQKAEIKQLKQCLESLEVGEAAVRSERDCAFRDAQQRESQEEEVAVRLKQQQGSQLAEHKVLQKKYREVCEMLKEAHEQGNQLKLELRQTRMQLEGDLSNARGELAAVRREADSQVEGMKRDMHRLESDLSSAKAELVTLRRNLQQEEAWSQQLQNERRRIEADLGALRVENSELVSAMQGAVREAKDHAALNATLEKERQRLSDNLMEAKRENLALVRQQPISSPRPGDPYLHLPTNHASGYLGHERQLEASSSWASPYETSAPEPKFNRHQRRDQQVDYEPKPEPANLVPAGVKSRRKTTELKGAVPFQARAPSPTSETGYKATGHHLW